MKTLIFSAMAVAGVLLVAVQHQQIGNLRADNSTLEQSSAEATKLKADLVKSTGNEAQDAAEIDRLREENHDLLKLRNEVNQLRETRAQFEKVSAENQRLQSLAKNAVHTESKQSVQTVVFRMDSLSNRGLGTPEDALQSFYWAQSIRSTEDFSRAITPKSWSNLQGRSGGWRFQGIDDILSVEIVARRDLDAMSVQLGIIIHFVSPQHFDRKTVVALVLEGGEWRVDASGY